MTGKAIDFSRPADEKDVYPAVHSFRAIAEAEADVEAALLAALEPFEVVSPLARGRSSSGGKYQVFHFSARLDTRARHHALDAAVKSVPGIRILL